MPGSKSAPRTVILADDLTGALDCAAAFITVGESGHPFVALELGTEAPDDCGVVSINADSRRLTQDKAREAVREALDQIARSGDSLQYVKIDSTLRGHPGLEIEVAARTSSARIVLVTPAFPATGRVVAGGELLVNGVPLAETDVGRDPLSPVETSKVTEIIGKSTALQLHEISLEKLRSGSLAGELTALVPPHARAPLIVCCDAETDADLNALIAAGRSLEVHQSDQNPAGSALFAGSAGLAFALSRASQDIQSDVGMPEAPPFQSPILVVTASQRSLADRQIGALVERDLADLRHVEFIADASNGVADPDFDAGAIERSLVLRATIVGDLTGLPVESVRQIADHVTGKLGRLVGSLVSQHRVGGIVIIGGDTARTVLTAIQARGIVLAAEPLPGVPVGTIIGGLLDGVPIATKAGAFGDDQTLVNLFQYFSQDR